MIPSMAWLKLNLFPRVSSCNVIEVPKMFGGPRVSELEREMLKTALFLSLAGLQKSQEA